MSFDFSSLKWGRIVIGVIVGFVVALLVNLILQVGYGVVLGFQMRGAPPQEMMVAAVTEFAIPTPGRALRLAGRVRGRPDCSSPR